MFWCSASRGRVSAARRALCVAALVTFFLSTPENSPPPRPSAPGSSFPLFYSLMSVCPNPNRAGPAAVWGAEHGTVDLNGVFNGKASEITVNRVRQRWHPEGEKQAKTNLIFCPFLIYFTYLITVGHPIFMINQTNVCCKCFKCVKCEMNVFNLNVRQFNDLNPTGRDWTCLSLKESVLCRITLNSLILGHWKSV